MTHALVPGANVALATLSNSAEGGSVSIRVRGSAGTLNLDVSVLLLGEDRKVRGNDDFIFYNQPIALDGAIQLFCGDQDEQTLILELARVSPHAEVVAVVASVDDIDMNFGAVVPVELTLGVASSPEALARFEMVGLTIERAVVLCELYRRDDAWKIRAVGQGYAGGLAELAIDFGVEVDAEGEASPPEEAGRQTTPTSGVSVSVEPEPDVLPPTSDATGSSRAIVGRRRKPAKIPSDWNARPSPFLGRSYGWFLVVCGV